MRLFFAFLLVLFLSPPSVCAAEEVDNTSHLPIPRFASLRSGEVNMRTGPGMRYPIDWVYTRRGLPVEITAEYDIWRRVRDPKGTEGWISKTELTGKRTAVVVGEKCELRDSRNDQAASRAHLDVGAIGQISSCGKEWCKMKFDGIRGFLRKDAFWGAYADETFD
ncbi:MAG: SH3 domain-containing protein [Bdellovibrionales bacterium]